MHVYLRSLYLGETYGTDSAYACSSKTFIIYSSKPNLEVAKTLFEAITKLPTVTSSSIIETERYIKKAIQGYFEVAGIPSEVPDHRLASPTELIVAIRKSFSHSGDASNNWTAKYNMEYKVEVYDELEATTK